MGPSGTFNNIKINKCTLNFNKNNFIKKKKKPYFDICRNNKLKRRNQMCF